MKKFLYIVFFLLLIGIGALLYFLFAPNKERIDLFTDDHPMIANGKVLEESFHLYRDTPFVSLSFAKEHIDHTIYLDQSIDSLSIVSLQDVFLYPVDEDFYYHNEEKIDSPPSVIEKEGKIYLSLEILNEHYPHILTYSEKEQTIVFHGDERIEVGTAQKDTVLRKGSSSKEPIVSDVVKGETLTVLRTIEKWHFVQKENGYFGYIPVRAMSNVAEKKKEIASDQPKEQAVNKQDKINLVWEAVYNVPPNPKDITIDNIQVVSPTWFHLENEKGDVVNKADSGYVSWAKKKKMDVWALYSNDFDPDKTHRMLTDYHARKNSIEQLASLVSMYGLDGINIDFENVYLEDKPHLVQYVKELTALLHRLGVIVSMDVTFPNGSDMWSNFLDRKALSEVVDYVMVMAYDEHWAASPVAGSVSSLPWVEQGIQATLKEVPAEKLILGIPFYTRVWKTDKDTGTVSADTLSMRYTKDWLQRHSATPVYDESTMQHYVEINGEKEKFQVWLEDETSVSHRIDLIEKYNLAGMGIWARDFGSDEIWKHLTYEKETNN